MRRVIFVAMFLFFFPLALLPGDVSGGSACSGSLDPPFIATGVKPNILIILDNSNSFDEDFYGNAVGSYATSGKSVVARQSLQTIVNDLQQKANVGIMTFSLPSDVQSYNLHNSMPFASYNPNSYCKDPPSDCVTYCTTGDSDAKGNCEKGCPGLTTTTYATGTGFPDSIITAYPTNNSTRARYCSLVYPKTQKIANPDDTSNNIYWNQSDPLYSSSNLGTSFGYCGSDGGHTYSTAENANNTYRVRGTKTGQSDAYLGYSGSSNDMTFQPTDSDWALGFYNFGQRMPWNYVGKTWFSSSSFGNTTSTPQGYLHVVVGDLTNSTQYGNVYNILNPNAGSSSGYMSCTSSNKNSCSYIVNAGNTPTAGTLATALNYFNGTLKQGSTTYSSPISTVCQKNYIIFVTDGLPDTLLNGNQPTDTASYCYSSSVQTNGTKCSTTADCSSSYNTYCASSALAQVLAQLDNLQTNVSHSFSGTSTVFPVKTYVLGMGLTATAKTNVDQMAVHGGTATTSGHAYYVDQPSDMTDALETIITDLLGRVSAGSAISILSEGQVQNGANMLQGVFYPSKNFGASSINWPGYLYNYWFYTSTNYSNIREDTVHDYILELDQDDALSFLFDNQNGLTISRYADSGGTGDAATYVDNVGLDSLTPIWEAGKMLWQTAVTSRTIYTPGTSSTGLVSFDTSNTALTTASSTLLGSPSSFDACLQVSSTNSNWQTLTLQNLVSYVRGTDITNCRNRTVGLCSDNSPCNTDSDCKSGSCTKNVWKLGDIVYSSPRVEADYTYCYNSTTSTFNSTHCSADSDCTSGGFTSCQKKESMIYVGANDGMLHAFKTGILSTTGLNTSDHQVATVTGIPTTDMGKELWAFIPQNSLPYLRCLAIPPPNSCHLFYNDLSPYLTTMVSNGVSKTVLIGGMRLGGGAVASGNFCVNSSGASNSQTCTQTSDCKTSPYTKSCSTGYYINAPSDTCSSLSSTSTLQTMANLCSNSATCYNPSGCTGLSSYYALDITDAENPKLLWEFSHPFLGYSYSGPAVIHKWTDPTHLAGDQYYVMFLSGPTTPSDGSSIQDVQVFVLTLNANLGISSVYVKDLGLQKGFGGRLFNSGLDVNGDGYTDFVFFGYSYSPTGSSTGWKGGIAKVNTNNTDATAAMNPKNWTYDVTTYSGITSNQLPITAAIAPEQCFGTWYLYAGTGRYLFPLDDYGGPQNTSGLNYLMGFPFTCDQYNNNCTTIASLNTSAASCSALQQGTLGQAGWMYTLDGASTTNLRERMITDPTVSTGNKIYFTTTEPTSDVCGYGGQSRVWGMDCANGAAISDKSCSGYSVTDLTGNLYLQTSTGAIYGVNADSFTDSSTGNRTTQWFVGIPPENSLPFVQTPTAAVRGGMLMQWIEK